MAEPTEIEVWIERATTAIADSVLAVPPELFVGIGAVLFLCCRLLSGAWLPGSYWVGGTTFGEERHHFDEPDIVVERNDTALGLLGQILGVIGLFAVALGFWLLVEDMLIAAA